MTRLQAVRHILPQSSETMQFLSLGLRYTFHLLHSLWEDKAAAFFSISLTAESARSLGQVIALCMQISMSNVSYFPALPVLLELC